ncbi:MAG: hypothetical protein EPN45_17990 [Rhizobiaceae bacterium]|nr:MAG: hypothetical protein EPN45_17990 [Rhizobiaceae bacterium]
MTWLNSNTFHNVCSFLLLIFGALGSYDWTSLGASPETALHIVSGIALVTSIVKLAVNMQRDGLAGMVKPQPSVGDAPSSAPPVQK